MPMWQKKMHSLSFWFSQEQRFSRQWAVWGSCTGGPSSSTELETERAGTHRQGRVIGYWWSSTQVCSDSAALLWVDEREIFALTWDLSSEFKFLLPVLFRSILMKKPCEAALWDSSHLKMVLRREAIIFYPHVSLFVSFLYIFADDDLLYLEVQTYIKNCLQHVNSYRFSSSLLYYVFGCSLATCIKLDVLCTCFKCKETWSINRKSGNTVGSWHCELACAISTGNLQMPKNNRLYINSVVILTGPIGQVQCKKAYAP